MHNAHTYPHKTTYKLIHTAQIWTEFNQNNKYIKIMAIKKNNCLKPDDVMYLKYK